MNLNEKVEFLESMGFEIHHEISSVGHSDCEFDFSATAMDIESILSVVIRKVYESGRNAGREDMQSELKKLLGLSS